MQSVTLFDVIELIVDLPHQGLYAGMQGTVLDVHGDGNAFEVEFSDEQGRVLCFLSLPPEQFMLVWRAQQRQWIPLSERIAELVSRLPEPVGGEVLDFVRFLSVRSNQQSRNQGTHVLVAEDHERYRT